jgi:hypothetical protein
MEWRAREVKGEKEEGNGDNRNKAHPINKIGGETRQ